LDRLLTWVLHGIFQRELNLKKEIMGVDWLKILGFNTGI
jgi:hypothetical protein